MGPVQFAVFMGNRNDNMQDHSELRNGLERETRRRQLTVCVLRHVLDTVLSAG